MDDWNYSEVQCGGCGEVFTEDKAHYKLFVFETVYENGMLDALSTELVKAFHYQCCDEEAIFTEAMPEFTCSVCGHDITQDESFWDICVNKEKAVQNSIEPEWGASLRFYCHSCAHDLDLFAEAIYAIKPVVIERFRDKVTPMDGTYIPSKIKRCPTCGSRKDRKDAMDCDCCRDCEGGAA